METILVCSVARPCSHVVLLVWRLILLVNQVMFRLLHSCVYLLSWTLPLQWSGLTGLAWVAERQRINHRETSWFVFGTSSDCLHVLQNIVTRSLHSNGGWHNAFYQISLPMGLHPTSAFEGEIETNVPRSKGEIQAKGLSYWERQPAKAICGVVRTCCQLVSLSVKRARIRSKAFCYNYNLNCFSINRETGMHECT